MAPQRRRRHPRLSIFVHLTNNNIPHTPQHLLKLVFRQPALHILHKAPLSSINKLVTTWQTVSSSRWQSNSALPSTILYSNTISRGKVRKAQSRILECDGPTRCVDGPERLREEHNTDTACCSCVQQKDAQSGSMLGSIACCRFTST
ncbi:Uncharacterized protein HZ326_26857 [Fusarium oxysporum f. sp. albedinis]|nr:Uncharacterized protein HZ326_26857 [Fusarium oxysporum f. sp. albedinis]